MVVRSVEHFYTIALFSLHLVWYWQGEFIGQSLASEIGDLFPSWPIHMIQGCHFTVSRN